MAKRILDQVVQEAVVVEVEELVVGQPEPEESVEEQPNLEDTVVKEYEVADVDVRQLHVSVQTVFESVEGCVSVDVENIGGGDAYVDTKSVDVVNARYLPHGSKTTFEGSPTVYVFAASRPKIRVTRYK